MLSSVSSRLSTFKTTIAMKVNGFSRRVPAWPLYIIAILPPVLMFLAALDGRLGVDPVKALEHKMGELGLQILLATFSISPLRRVTGISLIKYRRALGLIGFFYIFLHLLVWLILDVQIPSEIIKDILKRPYITVGMVSFILMLPLVATSNNWSVRQLRAKWHKLHLLTYPVVVLGGIHFVLLRKGVQLEPILYLLAAILLVGWRYIPRRR